MKKYISLLCFLLIGLSLSGQSLEEYWQLAAENNPTLKAKFTLYLSALERVNQQSALPDPNLSFGYFISPVETRVGAQRFKLSLSQMFPWMGTTAAKENLAIKMAEARFAEFEEARNSLFLKVSETWLLLSELNQEIELKKENLRLLKTYEPIAKTKYESNLTSLADLIRIQIRIEEATTSLELLDLKRRPLVSDFNTYLNRPVDSEIDLGAMLTMSSSDSNLDSALVNNPKIAANQKEIDGADVQIQLAELKRKPNVGLGLDYVMVSKRTDMAVTDNGKDVLMPMVSISLPIFGKKNRSLKKEAELYKEGLQQQTQGIQNDIRNQWVKADYLESTASRELELYEKEIRSTQSLLNVLTSEYSNNSSNFEDLLLTQQQLLQLQIAQIKAMTKQYQSWLQKKYLTGNFLTIEP